MILRCHVSIKLDRCWLYFNRKASKGYGIGPKIVVHIQIILRVFLIIEYHIQTISYHLIFFCWKTVSSRKFLLYEIVNFLNLLFSALFFYSITLHWRKIEIKTPLVYSKYFSECYIQNVLLLFLSQLMPRQNWFHTIFYFDPQRILIVFSYVVKLGIIFHCHLCI